MPDAIFERVRDDLFPTAELVDLRGWGESLLLPEIGNRIDDVVRHNAKVRFVTNLSFRRDNVIDQLIEAEAILDVSIDTASPELLSSVRGGARLDLIDRNLRRLVKNERMQKNVTILATVQKSTVAGLPELVDFAADIGVSTIRFSPVTCDEDSDMDISKQTGEVDESLLIVQERARARGVRVEIGAKVGSASGEMGGGSCIHPWSYCYISYEGNVGFCDHLIGEGDKEYLVGNILTQDFTSIWNSKKMSSLREEHLAGNRDPKAPLFAHCAWCYKNKYVDFEDMLAPELGQSRVILAE